MKKIFVEPKIQRIDLNLKENIAASGGSTASYHVLVDSMFTCTLQNTGEYMLNLMMQNKLDLIETCKVYVNSNAKIYGALIPEEEANRFLGR